MNFFALIVISLSAYRFYLKAKIYYVAHVRHMFPIALNSRLDIISSTFYTDSMAYMAVGSRQILFADAPAPAMAPDTVREVAAVEDNVQARPADLERPAETEPAVNEAGSPAMAAEPDRGTALDTRA